MSRQLHVLNQHRACLEAGALIFVAAHRHYVAEHLCQIAGNGDLLDRIGDLAILDPEAGSAAGVVAIDNVDPLPHQLGHQQAGTHLLEHAIEILTGIGYLPVVDTAGVARAGQPQLAGGVGGQQPAHQLAIAHNVHVAGQHAFAIKRGAGEPPQQVGELLDGEPLGQDLLAQFVQQEARLAVEVATTDGHHQMTPQPGRRIGMEQHGCMAGGDLAGTEAGDGAFHRLIGNALRAPQPLQGTAGGVTVIALHVAVLLADQHAAQGVARGGIAFDEAVTVAIDLDAEVAGETGAVGVLDTGIAPQRQPLALGGQLDAILGIQRDRVAQLQIRGVPGQQICIRQTGTLVRGGMARNFHGRFHGGANGWRAQIRGGRGALAAITIDGDAERPILVEFDAFQFTAPGVYRQPGLLADGDFGQRGAQSFGYLQGFGNHGLEMGLILADLVLLIHNSHLYEGKERG